MSDYVPMVSVLLPVYNGVPYLAEAIASILNQTWKDFELIIINDGSTDGTGEIAQSFTDSRVRYFEQNNIGLAATLNRGIGLSRGAYIARQDADDISKPERFAKQVAYMEMHPDCGLIGTWADLSREGESANVVLMHQSDSTLIKIDLLFSNPFVHSSIMMRKKCIEELGGYAEDFSRQPPEDFELWSRFARRYELANIPEPLVIYREVSGSLSRSPDSHYWEHIVTICQENIHHYLGNEYDRTLVRGAVCLIYGVKDQSEQPDSKSLKHLIRDLAKVLETRYPEHRVQIHTRLRHFFHIMLHSRYSHFVRSDLARYLVLFRSLWLFR